MCAPIPRKCRQKQKHRHRNHLKNGFDFSAHARSDYNSFGRGHRTHSATVNSLAKMMMSIQPGI